MFKYALIYGMSSDEFWYGNPQDYFVYEDAFAEKQKLRHDELDVLSWLSGKYNMVAFAQAYSNAWSKQKKDIYPKKPLTFLNAEASQNNGDMRERFITMVKGTGRQIIEI